MKMRAQIWHESLSIWLDGFGLFARQSIGDLVYNGEQSPWPAIRRGSHSRMISSLGGGTQSPVFLSGHANAKTYKRTKLQILKPPHRRPVQQARMPLRTTSAFAYCRTQIACRRGRKGLEKYKAMSVTLPIRNLCPIAQIHWSLWGR